MTETATVCIYCTENRIPRPVVYYICDGCQENLDRARVWSEEQAQEQ